MLLPHSCKSERRREVLRFPAAPGEDERRREAEGEAADVRHHRDPGAAAEPEAEELADKPERAPEPRLEHEGPFREARKGEDDVAHPDLAAREAVREGAHAGGNGAGSAQHHGGEVRGEKDLRQRGDEAADQIEAEEEAPAPDILEERADQIEEEQVAQQVQPAAVEEHVQQPADLQRAARRHQREPRQDGGGRGGEGVVDLPIELAARGLVGLGVGAKLRQIDLGVLLPLLVEARKLLRVGEAVDEALRHLEPRVLLPEVDDPFELFAAGARGILRHHVGRDEEDRAEAGDDDRHPRHAIDLGVFDLQREEEEHPGYLPSGS